MSGYKFDLSRLNITERKEVLAVLMNEPAATPEIHQRRGGIMQRMVSAWPFAGNPRHVADWQGITPEQMVEISTALHRYILSRGLGVEK